MRLVKTLTATAMAVAAFGAHANLVTNGSFEDNLQAAGTWNIYSNLTGWTGISNIELRNNVAGTAQDGVNFVELDTTQNMSMKQTITGSGLYELSFWYSARPNVAAGDNILGFSFGSLSGQVLQTTAGTNANVWQQYTGLVNLSGPTDLIFSALGTSNSYGGSLDNITVTAAVPEPETYALLLAGLGLVGTIVRRRKAQQA
ncbi:MAG: hypothetical protein RIR09_2479 [Pseudomonadota bacterium]|jgi:hypothetical protein